MKKHIFSLAVSLIAASSMAYADVVDSPEGYRPVAIGNGTPAQGIVRIDGPDGEQTYHQVNDFTVFKRFGGGTATVNGGDGVANAHQAELLNRQSIINSLPDYDASIQELSVEIYNDMKIMEQDFQSLLNEANGAAAGATALAGIDFTGGGNQIGIGVGSVGGENAFAIKGMIDFGGNVYGTIGGYKPTSGSGGGSTAIMFRF